MTAVQQISGFTPSEDEPPAWSGVPVTIGATMALVPLHVSDTRAMTLDDWLHVNYYTSLDGEVEYHLYCRL